MAILIRLGTTYKVLTMNIPAQSVSEYSNYNFNSFCKFNGVYLGADSSGIHTLSGDTDNAVSIQASIKTGIWDIGSEFIKRLTDVWIGILGNGGYEITVITDDNGEAVYSLQGAKNTTHIIKTNTARGVKGRYWQITLRNTGGSDFRLDSINTNMFNTKRRV